MMRLSKPSTITSETAAAMSDDALIAAYLDDCAAHVVGVNYYIAAEMESRGYRNRRTKDLTIKGRRAASAIRDLMRESRGDVDVLALCALMGWLVILAALWFVGHDAVAGACSAIAPLAARPKRFLPIANHHHKDHTMTATITANDNTGTIIVRWSESGRSFEAVADEHEGGFAVYETTTGQSEYVGGGDTLHEALSEADAPADVLDRVRMRAVRIGERAEIDAEAELTKRGQWHVRIVVTDLTAGRFENMLGDIVEGITLIEPWYEDTVDVLTMADLDKLADEAMAAHS
jgi:hypothetical protein